MPPAALEGNAYEEETPNRGVALPHNLPMALDQFKSSAFAKTALGTQMHMILCAIKQAEVDVFAQDMSALERRSFL